MMRLLTFPLLIALVGCCPNPPEPRVEKVYVEVPTPVYITKYEHRPITTAYPTWDYEKSKLERRIQDLEYQAARNRRFTIPYQGR